MVPRRARYHDARSLRHLYRPDQHGPARDHRQDTGPSPRLAGLRRPMTAAVLHFAKKTPAGGARAFAPHQGLTS
ncbi:hypothetical protein PM01_01275 [Sulfitobacter pontiacus 3SOLIMAR09]|nr:hypothetical protein PM01_01275 [Sulfitobacter pontiacus 3SOLIMAR09]